MKQIWCVYSSGWGNTRLVVDYIWEVFDAKWITFEKTNALVAETHDLTRYTTMILAAPTYDHGVLHRPYENFLYRCKDVDLRWYQFGIVWLWNDTYDAEYTCESALLLQEFVLSHGGELCGDLLKIHKCPLPVLHSNVWDWVESCWF